MIQQRSDKSSTGNWHCPRDGHEWDYDAGDPTTGVNAAWICKACGHVDDKTEPPTDDDDIR